MPPFPLDNCPVPPPDLVIEGAQFIYNPNFEGREETYNEPGNRYFNVRIPDNIVEAVQADNWNMSWTKPSSKATPQQIADHVPEPFLKVSVGFTYRPPTILLMQDGQQTVVDETTAGLIDTMQFENIDIVLRGRAWSNPSGCGIKAWLKTFVGVVEMDDIQRKYARLSADA